MVFGLALIMVLAFGVYTWDKNQELNRSQDYRLYRMDECRSISEMKRAYYESNNLVGDWYYTQYNYILDEDKCAFETEHILRGSDNGESYSTTYYSIIDMFTEESLGGFTIDSQGNFSGDEFQCKSYNDLRVKYFKKTTGPC